MKNFIFTMNRALAAEKKHFSFLLMALCSLFMVLMPFNEMKAWTVKDGIKYSAASIGEYIEHDYYSVICHSPQENNYDYLSGNIYIKKNLYGKDVEDIRDYAFHHMSGLVNIICPSTIKTIGDKAFNKATGLMSIEMNEGLTDIGKSAFFYCTNLTSVLVPKTVIEIKSSTFKNCTSLPGISLPGVKFIREMAFDNCKSLVFVQGGCNGEKCPVQTIGRSAFSDCINLTSIDFPNLVSIGDGAFANCKKLSTVVLQPTLTTISRFAFKNCGLKVVKNQSTKPQKILANVFDGVDLSKCILYVPKGCKADYQAADVWKNFGNILEPGEQPVDNQPEETPEEEKVKPIYVGLQKIGDMYYKLNEDLTASVIQDDNNKKLSGELTIPASVKYDGYTYSVTSLGNNVFADCPKLTSVILPNTITEIPSRTFYSCKGLTKVTLPSTLTKIDDSAFCGCEALQTISLPATLTEIGSYAFYQCKSLVSVSIPAGVKTIKVGCFDSCEKLSYVKLPEGLTKIEEYAFYQCKSLVTITLPASLSSVEARAFSETPALSYVTSMSVTPPTAEYYSFEKVSPTCVLYVPAGSVSDYQNAAGWKEFKDIREKGVNETIKYGKLYYRLSENGTAVVTYEKNEKGNYTNLFGEITVEQYVNYQGMDYEVQGVGLYAFRYATPITKVNLPNSIKSIEGKAFYGCTSLMQINIPTYLDVLSNDAFTDSKLYNENIDKDGAVYYDNCLLALTKPVSGSYTVKEGTRLIANWAIMGQEGITSLTLPEGLTCLCKESINQLENLKTLSLPTSLSYIGEAIFNNCGSLSDLYNYADEPYDLVGVDVFKGLDRSKCTLYVPKGSKDAYSNAVYWDVFPIKEMDPEVFTVTFLDWDGKEFGTQMVEKGKDANDDHYVPWREGYAFTDWDKDFTNITEDLIVTAQYEKRKYIVEFVDWDAHSLGSQIVEYGESAEAPEDPERDGYTFIGWDTDFSIVTKQLYITALYAPKVWTVTYLNWDDELIGAEQVQDGEDAKGMVATKVGWYFDYWYNTKNFEEVDLKNITSDLTVKAQFTYEVTFTVTYRVEGVTTFEIEAVYGFDVSKIYYNPKDAPKIPEKASDAMYDYTFVGWTPEVEYLLNNVVLEAVFEPSLRKFDVTFYDWDDTKLDAQIVEYGKGAEAPTPTRKGYTFVGWDQDFDYVTMDMDVKAQYTINSYSVSFVDWNGTVLGTQTVEYGSAATPPADPTRTGYTFTGWDKKFDKVEEDMTVTALYEINKCTVTFLDKEGNTIGEAQSVAYGSAAVAPKAPIVTGYTFTGWDKDFSNITSDLTVKALYQINVYTVTFLDKNGKQIGEAQKIEYGSAAVAPKAPEVEGYHFTGWDKAFDNISEDLTVQAQYAINVYTVTFVDKAGKQIGDAQEIEHGSAAEAPEAPAVEGYTFTGWDKAFDNVTSDLTVQAQYAILVYTVTFVDYDDKELKSETVDWGKAATAPADPKREGYTFTGWDKAFDNVKSDLTVKAQYEINVYTVIFVDKDGKTIKTEEVDWGKAATAPEAPAVTGWTFTGWDKAFDNVKSDLTVQALYAINTYTVTFADWNSEELKSETVDYGKAATAPSDPKREGYTFKGWDKDFSNVTEDLTVTAQYAINVYTVTFLDKDGKTIKTEKVEWGKAATAPEAPEVAGWTFAGWDKAFNVVKSDLTVQATYTKNPVYTVTFKDYDGSVIATVKVEEGKSAVKPDDPIREGYTFTGWDKKFDNVTSDLTVQAQYTINVYTVIFVDKDGKTIKTEEVEWSKGATAPEAPAVEGYHFTGWDKKFDKVTSDLTVKAQYAINVYTVTFVDYDDQELKSETVDYGKAATAPSDPKREGYTFKGWDKDFSNITGDLTVKAQYAINVYTVIFLDKEGKQIGEAQKVEYGSAATAPNAPLVEGYHFTGWDKAFDKVTSDLTVKALYEINVYTVTFLDKDGKTIKTEEVEHGMSAAAPNAPAVTGYTFTGWDKAFDNITADLTVAAQYTINVYTVTFVDKDGNPIGEAQEVEYGNAAVAPKAPAVSGYTFIGWDKAFNNITSDLTVKALYQINVYTVIFVDKDGKQIGEEQHVEYNNAAVAPEAPAWEGHVFTGWDSDYQHVKSDLTVKPQYEVQTFMVTFIGFNGKELKSETVEYGKSATAPEAPEVEGYHFVGWDKAFSNITSMLVVIAQYEINVYTVTFVDWDAIVLKREEVEHGKSATAPADPTRDGYTFIGWDKTFSNITGDLTVTAQYEENPDYTPQNLSVTIETVGDNDTQITLTWDKVEGAVSYDLRMAIGEQELFTQNTMTLNTITALLSVLEKQYQLIPGTYLISWFVRSTNAMGQAISDWAQGEAFEVTIKEPVQGVEDVSGESRVESQKLMRNGLIYIIRNGRTYDVNGKLVE